MKICYTCKIKKTFQDFSPNNRKKDGLDPNCKECRRARGKAYYHIPGPEKVRDSTGKVCSKCSEFKVFEDFGARKNSSDGRKSACKICVREDGKLDYSANFEKHQLRKKIVYQENKDEILERCKEYRESNKEEISKRRSEDRVENPEKYQEYGKSYRSKYPENANNYQNKRRKIDPLFKLKCNLRVRLNKMIKYHKFNKNNSFKQYIGCSLEELKSHLENQFTTGMTWENYGQWHVDHIVPLSSAKTEEKLYKLCHYTNLQPLWAIDNLRKGAK